MSRVKRNAETAAIKKKLRFGPAHPVQVDSTLRRIQRATSPPGGAANFPMNHSERINLGLEVLAASAYKRVLRLQRS